MGKSYIRCLYLILCFFSTDFILSQSAQVNSKTGQWFDVMQYGAKSDGVTDNKNAFLETWEVVCSSHTPAVFYVPNGKYLLTPITFLGPCSNSVRFQVSGHLIASTDAKWNILYWIQFQNIKGLTFKAPGKLDGKGASWWGKSCHKDSENACVGSPVTLKFISCTHISLDGVKSVNSKHFHIAFDGCKSVKAKGLNLRAPNNSPNTDGVHIQKSSGVKIVGSNIATGDDCVSIGSGSSNILIHGVKCGPGHGISVGSLGRESDKGQGVKNVTVERVTFYGTQNGLRIKTWEGGNGFVKDVTYKDITMVNVSNPIKIDQFYCPFSYKCPPKGERGVSISGVKFQDVKGTSATKVAVWMACNKRLPCQGISMHNVGLQFSNPLKHGALENAVAYCKNAYGYAKGTLSPSSCLHG